MALFKGKARCILCRNGPNFTNNQFHTRACPQAGPMKEDLVRFYVTQQERDKGAFKTPALRSIIETSPYMHDGVSNTLEEAIEFLGQGGVPYAHLSPWLKPLGLTKAEKADLLAFLNALTGEQSTFGIPTFPK